MDWLLTPLAVSDFSRWEEALASWFFLLSLAFLGFEVVRYLVLKQFKWALLGDTLANFATQIMFLVITYGLMGGLYLATYAFAAQFALFDIPTSLAIVLVCLVLADLAYYWEHRALHRINLLWATHSTHHSSPFFNISVAYRFGPLDGLWPIFFHLPLVLIGFDPFLVFFCELVVQLFQTALHTEAVKKLPRPIEWLFNTPSHHRVHHGSNPQYIDKNYGGILIIWDRMFGTFAEEKEPVTYGLVEPLPELNTPGRTLAAPFVAFFHGFTRLAEKVASARSLRQVWLSIFGTPEWQLEDTKRPPKS